MTIVTVGDVLGVGGVEVGGGVGLSLVVRVLVLVVRVPEPPAQYWWLTKISNKLLLRSENKISKNREGLIYRQMRSYESSLGRDSRESSEDTDVERGRVTGSSCCSVRCILFLLLVRRLGTGRQNIAAVARVAVAVAVLKEMLPPWLLLWILLLLLLSREMWPPWSLASY